MFVDKHKYALRQPSPKLDILISVTGDLKSKLGDLGMLSVN